VRKRAVVVLALAAASAAPALALPAFPGADGFGANALGGRGGAVYHVTNLTDNASAPAAGSFRAVLAQIKTDETRKTNPITAATVVFDVGGTIQLTDNLDVKNVNNVTIAGQTAPGPGINLVGYKFDVTSSATGNNAATSNIVVRYIADRRGNTISPADDDAMGVLGSTSDQNHNTHDVILDHVTAAWGMDEDLSVTDSATNVTIQNSFITEALESGHQFGSLIRPRFGASVSYIGNLYANNRSRNPRPGTYNNSLLNFDFRNNTIYNWGDRAGYTGGATDVNTEFVNMNYTGNYVIAGPSTPSAANNTAAFLVDTSQGVKDPLVVQVYQANNLIDLNRNSIPDGVNTGWNAFVQYNGTTTSPFGSNQNANLTTTQEASPFAYPTSGSTTTDPTIAYQQTLASAGNTPWARNESDARVISQVQHNGGAILLTAPQNEYNDLINQTQVSRPANFDTDQDGMPNTWEQARGLNPSVADNNLVVSLAESPSLAGYTWLEMYLNDLTLQASWAGGTNGQWDSILNWNGQLPNLQDSTAMFGNVGGAAVVSVASNEHVGQLFFDNPAGYSVGGPGVITLDVLNHTGGTGAYATVTVASGNHTISTPVMMSSDTQFAIALGSKLTLSGALTATGKNITVSGGGSLVTPAIRANGVTVAAGTLQIAADGSSNGTSIISALSIAAGAKLDLMNNDLILNYSGASPVGTIRGYLVSAFNQGAWNGAGLASSSANPSSLTALGYADVSNTTFDGQTISGSAVVVKFTYYGDSNLDGKVDTTDFQMFLDGLVATSGSSWSQGDYTYDGHVDLGNDFNLFLVSYLMQGGALGDLAPIILNDSELSTSQRAQLLSAVPEPVSLTLLGSAVMASMIRRRSTQKNNCRAS
jgi:hypothetical protein